MGLMASWGFGAELVFKISEAIGNMRRASAMTRVLQSDLQSLRGDAKAAALSIGGIRLALDPLGAELLSVSQKADQLADKVNKDRTAMGRLVTQTQSTRSALRQTGHEARAVAFDFEAAKTAAHGLAGGLGQVGLALAPVGLLTGAMAARAAMLGADLEANMLTMRILVGDAAKSDELITRIRNNAAKTPFETGELIDASKRLLNLTGDNVDANMKLLDLVETMSAMNPTKSVIDATEALLDATSGGGFERLKEFPGLSLHAEMFKAAGESGGKAWGDAVVVELTKRVKEKTRGADLVGELAKTTRGRVSTLIDAINIPLTNMGTMLNERGRGLVISLTDGINAAAPVFEQAFKELFGSTVDAVGAELAPFLRDMRESWEALGKDGQKQLFKAVIAFGALATALTGIGGVLGVVGLGLGGVWTSLTSLWALASIAGPGIAAIGTMIVEAFAGVGSALMLGNIVPALAALPAILAVIGGLFVGAIAGASGFSEWIGQVGASLWNLGTTILGGLWNAVSSFFGGLLEGLQASGDQILATVGQPILDLIDTVTSLFSYLLPQTAEASAAWATFGRWVGYAFGWVVKLAAGIIRTVVTVVSGVLGILQPFIQGIGLFGQAIAGVLSGTMTGGEAAKTFMSGLVAWIGGLGLGIVSVVSLVLETILNLVGTALQAIPGVGDKLASWVFSGSGALASVRNDMNRQFADAVDRSSKSVTERDAAKADGAASVTVDFGESPLDFNLDLTSTVEIDGREVGKSQGKRAAKAGTRGTGPKLPEEQRARVLRRGLEVTPLRPSEVS